MVIIKKWWNKLLSHALEQVTDGVDPRQRLKFVVSVLSANAFGSMNIYAFSHIRILCFAPNVEEHNRCLFNVTNSIERRYSLTGAFDQVNAAEQDVHRFFQDRNGYTVDIIEAVERTLEYLRYIVVYLDRGADGDVDLITRKNIAILESNMEDILAYAECLYSIQKELSFK